MCDNKSCIADRACKADSFIVITVTITIIAIFLFRLFLSILILSSMAAIEPQQRHIFNHNLSDYMQICNGRVRENKKKKMRNLHCKNLLSFKRYWRTRFSDSEMIISMWFYSFEWIYIYSWEEYFSKYCVFFVTKIEW